MTSKHTPGPWEAYVGVVRTVPVVNDRGGMSGGYLIAETSLDDVARYANARLIAAAPDMLEVLEGVLPWIGGLANENPSCAGIYDAARAAIAKAHGEA